jgi:nucleoside-diphosphate-sugar epimerase
VTEAVWIDGVGVLGARSGVGECLLPQLTQAGGRVVAFSRQARARADDGVAWQQLPVDGSAPQLADAAPLPGWICVAPIWVLPAHFLLLDAHGVKRLVVLSSTSRFTKTDSSAPQEQAVARRLSEAEAQVQAWAESRGVEWVILRPTLIYGLGRDKNITEIARIIRRFGFFPVLGKAGGLRQPVHAADVADACVAALRTPGAVNRAYNLSGGETLAYRDMVARVFAALGRPPRLLTVPLPAFRAAVALLRCLPRYRHWSAAMAERMNRDLVFDHGDATRDLDFRPRAFAPSERDVVPLIKI